MPAAAAIPVTANWRARKSSRASMSTGVSASVPGKGTFQPWTMADGMY